MTRRPAALAAALAALVLPGAATAAEGLAVRNVDTSRSPDVRVTVTVPEGGRVRSFSLRENGRVVPPGDVRVQAPTGRMAVSLVIDASHTMRGRPLEAAVDAAADFLRRKGADDEVAIFSFGRQAQTVQPLTTDGVRLEQAVRRVQIGAEAGTAMYDAVDAGLRELAATPPTTRRVLIVLADGEDNTSQVTADALRDLAVRGQTTVYAVAIRSQVYDLATLEGIAGRTGGSTFEAATADLRTAYRSIAADLARSYVVTYPSTAGDRVRLAVETDGAVAETAFLAPARPTVTTGDGLIPAAVTHASWSAPLLALIAMGLVLFALLTTVFRPRPRRTLQQLLVPYTSFSALQDERASREPSVSVWRVLFGSTERTLGHLRVWKAVARTLERSALPLRTAELFYLMIASSLLAALVSAVLLGPGLLTVLALGIGALPPFVFVARRARKRQRAFDDLLPDTLMTMAGSMRAGHSFNQAMDTTVAEGSEPIAGEFSRVATEIRLGRAPDAALEQMAERMGSKNFAFVVTAVNIQRQVGGSMAEILDSVAETVRQRQQFLKKVKGLTAMGRASAYVLVAMPFALAAMITVMNRGFILPLFTTTAGHLMMGAALTSLTFGALILRKIVSFKV